MAGFLNPLRLEYIDGSLWKVLDQFEYCVGAADSPVKAVIEAGFMTDFASVPRPLWWLLPPTGEYGKAAVVHDYLYVNPWLQTPAGNKFLERVDADNIFAEAMGVLGVPKWKIRTMYAGVRVGGWSAWERYRAK